MPISSTDSTSTSEVNNGFLIELYKELLRVRFAETALAERYKQQEMRTPTHFGIGQEAIAVGVCQAVRKSDVAYSHHRSHNHFLAKGGSVYRLAAELFGRVTGCSGGRGGSVHLTDRDQGFIASSAILGEAMAAATGSALAFSMDHSDRISIAFFGDAVAEEGAFYECLNYAALHRLPVLFVCENNGYATESPLSIRQPEGASISNRVASFGIPAEQFDGNNVIAVYQAAQKAIASIRSGNGPYFLEFSTYRWLEHVGAFFDHEMHRTYRSKEELVSWQQHCPILCCETELLHRKAADYEILANLKNSTQQQILRDIERAYGDAWPTPSDLFQNVY